MRDFASWSIPLFRIFGIAVRLHLLYILFALGMILRVAYATPEHLLDIILVFMVMLFGIILLHELGHCFAARSVDGEASQILIWPLGGLATVEIPPEPRPHAVVAFAGPAVNLALCFFSGAILLAMAYVPPLNPIRLSSSLDPALYNYREGGYAVGEKYQRYVKSNTKEILDGGSGVFKDIRDPSGASYLYLKDRTVTPAQLLDSPKLPTWALWTARFFFLNWILFLFNLIPAFPLDGGQLLQAYVWSRSDRRNGMQVAAYAGFGGAILFVLLAIILNEATLGFLAVFMFLMSLQQWMMLEQGTDEMFMGYDFSQGYNSLEGETPVAPKPRRQSWIKRTLAARAERKAKREADQRAEDENHLDELLDKVNRLGIAALSDDEKKFMQRVSARYRNRS